MFFRVSIYYVENEKLLVFLALFSNFQYLCTRYHELAAKNSNLIKSIF